MSEINTLRNKMTVYEIITKVIAAIVGIGIAVAVLMMVITFESKATESDGSHSSMNPNDAKAIIRKVEAYESMESFHIHKRRKKRHINSDPDEMSEESRHIRMLQLTIEEDPQYKDSRSNLLDEEGNQLMKDYDEFPSQDLMKNEENKFLNIPHVKKSIYESEKHYPQLSAMRKHHNNNRHKLKKKRNNNNLPQTANINSLTYYFSNNSVYVIDRGQSHEAKNVFAYSWIELTTAAAAAVGLSVTIILIVLLIALYCTKSRKNSTTRPNINKLFLNMRDLSTNMSPHIDDEKRLNSVITKSYIQLERNPSGFYLTRESSKLLPSVVDEGIGRYNKWGFNADNMQLHKSESQPFLSTKDNL